MKKDYLNDEANILIVQKHQLNNSEDKISEIDSILLSIQNEQKNNDSSLDNMIDEMEKLLQDNEIKIVDNKISEIDAILLNIQLENEIKAIDKNIFTIKELDTVDFDENMSWDDYLKSIQEYSFRNNIDLKEDPFKHIMTKSQEVELQKRIKDEFSLKNAQCDKYDYMIAGTCGVITGLIDILFVGKPGESKLGDFTDEQANKITEKFAELLGWDKDKVIEKGSNTTASAIGFLEKKFKINYDQATTHATDGVVENLSLKNHHLKGLGHSPDIIGLFFSILNQFTNTSSFISNGQIITIETEEFELQGHNFIAKVFCGIANWFGHIMSDWTGSSGTVGQGGRGTGVPIPFYNLLQMINIGEFGQHKQTFATITTKVFEQGYDARHGITMAIPVVINELLIRFMYTMKAHFYHQKDWKDSMPSENIPELRRMLLVGHGTLCLIDGADAYIRSGAGSDMVAFLSSTNLIAWVRFGHLGLKELNAWYNSGHIDSDAVDKYIDDDLKQMLNKNR
ncbi:DUF515 domain-containing protein [Aliarcobacter butzleri]|uniref:DUF515 domain-containing protein n=1 Tax=Aliarcobacter butzleri TaxID=28197 RepID=A0AAW6VSG2_9BACT|nr:DUF515 domain-containing protein [Aliarcobacter butzleri]MCG3688808.1 DUF515 domain-containing protein [Aliarcobacter butzleri]MDK2063119.1 DUF515 domain-containing protein [Aliarcobacter butzleri]